MSLNYIAPLFVPLFLACAMLTACTTVAVRGQLPPPRSAVSVPQARGSELLDAIESYMAVQGFKRTFSKSSDTKDLICQQSQQEAMLCYSSIQTGFKISFNGVFVFQPRPHEDRVLVPVNFVDLSATPHLDNPESAVYRGLLTALRAQFETDLAVHHPFLAPP